MVGITPYPSRGVTPMSSKTKSKPKVQTQVLKQVKPEELERELEQLRELKKTLIIRYGVALGVRYWNQKIMKKRANSKEMNDLREVNAEIKKIFEEAEKSGKFDTRRFRELKKKKEELRERLKKLTEKEMNMKKELYRHLKYIDNTIMISLGITEKDAITDPSKIPEHLRAPSKI